jgi:hypothetical protein
MYIIRLSELQNKNKKTVHECVTEARRVNIEPGLELKKCFFNFTTVLILCRLSLMVV